MAKEVKPNPYDFIKRQDTDQPGKFACSHPEAKGAFSCKRLTPEDLSDIENLQASIQGLAVNAKAEALARWQAWCALGFESSPDGFEPGKVYSEALLHALYVEVETHYNYFRESAIQGAF